MATKRAKTITKKDLDRVHQIIKQGEHPVANRLKMDLSFYAGLRACEITRLTTDAFLDPNGEICKNLTIFSHVAKKGRERTIPIHPELRKSIEAFLKQYPETDYIAVGRKPGPQQISAVTVWFYNIYKKAGLKGCSSHSGRRSFITDLSKRIGYFNGSLRDV